MPLSLHFIDGLAYPLVSLHNRLFETSIIITVLELDRPMNGNQRQSKFLILCTYTLAGVHGVMFAAEYYLLEYEGIGNIFNRPCNSHKADILLYYHTGFVECEPCLIYIFHSVHNIILLLYDGT